jgi:hypothetical protein
MTLSNEPSLAQPPIVGLPPTYRVTLRATAMLALVLGVAGCTSLPKFGAHADAQVLAPKASDITDKIQCEIIEALHSAKYDEDSPVKLLAVYPHVVSVNLTLEVTNNEAVNPSLSYIKPYLTAGTNFTAILGGQWTGSQDRIFTESFTLVFDLGDETLEKWSTCTRRTQSRGGGLQGNLGIRDVIASGLRYEMPDSEAYTLKVLGLSKNDPQDPLTNAAAVAPSFGSTIDFTITYGVNGGPTWTLTHFSGPSSTGLLSTSRTHKDTLIVSFARVISSGTTTDANRRAESAAGRAAKDNLTNQILQRLRVVP